MQRVSPFVRTGPGKLSLLPMLMAQAPVPRVPVKRVDTAVLEVVARNIQLAKRRSPRQDENDLKLVTFPSVETAVRVKPEMPAQTAEEVEEQEAEATTPILVWPSDDVIQDVVVGVAKEHYAPYRKTSWGKSAHAFCCGMVGYGHKGHEVEIYLRKRLEGMIAERRATGLAMHEDGMEAELTRKAVRCLDEIEEILVELVRTQGHPPKAAPTQPDHQAAVLSLGFKSKRKIFVIYNTRRVAVGVKKAKTRMGLPKYRYQTLIEIVSVQSARDYRHTVKHRFSGKERTRRKQDERVRHHRHESERWEFRRTA